MDVNEGWCKGQVFEGRQQYFQEHILLNDAVQLCAHFCRTPASMYCQLDDASVLKKCKCETDNNMPCKTEENIWHTCFCDDGLITKLHGIRGHNPVTLQVAHTL